MYALSSSGSAGAMFTPKINLVAAYKLALSLNKRLGFTSKLISAAGPKGRLP